MLKNSENEQIFKMREQTDALFIKVKTGCMGVNVIYFVFFLNITFYYLKFEL